jgi:hypothetical protein
MVPAMATHDDVVADVTDVDIVQRLRVAQASHEGFRF